MKIAHLAAFASLALAAAACELRKTENPLSPTVAGPIPGVEISAPRLLEPGSGWQIAGDKQPVTLLLENASSNGPRPLSYSFEISTDAGFTNRVFTRENVAPGDNGRTSLRLPDPLSTGRSYYWRAKAQDGANEGPFSAPTSFNVYTPVGFDKPTPISPANNTRVDTVTPEFRFANAPQVGSPGQVYYTIEVAGNDAFAPASTWQVAEQPGETRLTAPSGLAPNSQLYWRVRATGGGVTGPWSNTAVFRTPVPIVVTPPTRPAPDANCGGSSALAIVECTRTKFSTHMGHDEIVRFLRAAALNLNNAGIGGGPYGILRKANGESCSGYSCDILCAGSGTSQVQYDVLIDSTGAQVATWGGPKTYPNIRIDSCVAP